MSQKQQGENEAAIDELLGEIAFQRVLLSSIDDKVEHRAEAEHEILSEIKSLQTQLRALGYLPSSSQLTSSQASFATSPPASPLDMDEHGRDDDAARGTAARPGKLVLTNRKRSHSKHLDGGIVPEDDQQPRRASPAVRSSAMPSSGAGIESDLELTEYEKAMADNEEKYRRRQKAIEEKFAVERADRELAKAFQLEPAAAAASSTSSSSHRSALDRISGGSRWSAPSQSPGPQAMASSSSSLKANVEAARLAQTLRRSLSNTKPEPQMGSGLASSSSSRMPGTYDSSDDDIEVIPASRFTPNPRRPTSSGLSARTLSMTNDEIAAEAIRNSLPKSKIEKGAGKVVPKSNSSHLAMFGFGDRRPSWMGNVKVEPRKTHIETMIRKLPAKPKLGLASSSAHRSADSLVKAEPTIPAPEPSLPMLEACFHSSAFAPNGSGPEPEDHYTQTAQEIKALMLNIRPDEDILPNDREQTPAGLKTSLYEHQKLGLTWLRKMEEGSNKGGMLADDMGLGKTIQILALMLARPSDLVGRKTTLIIGPVALIRQWQREISTKIETSHTLSVHLAHGQQKRFTWDQLRKYDVVLTSYGTLAAEFKRFEKYKEQQKALGVLNEDDMDQVRTKSLFPLLGPKSVFYRVILDEAQCIKNRRTVSAKACFALRSVTRFCLSGTPMMNNVGELASLIHFLGIRPYCDQAKFDIEFKGLTKGESDKSAMTKLQALLKAILLRRVKDSLIDGKPIITLPPKTEEVLHVVFDEDQQEFYNALEAKTQVQYNKYMRSGTVMKNYSHVLVLLLRLRQACCHPHLIMDFENAPVIMAEMELAKSLSEEVVTRLKEAEESFECPICMDAVENPTLTLPCGHHACRVCLDTFANNTLAAQIAEGNDGNAGIKCPTCRGPIDMKKIIEYATFKKVHITGEVPTAEDAADVYSETEDDTEIELDTEDDLDDFVVPDDFSESEKEVPGGSDDDFLTVRSNKSKPKPMPAKKSTRSKFKGKGKGKATDAPKAKNAFKSMAMLKTQANRSAKGRRVYMAYLKKHWQPSAKLTKTMELLERFRTEGRKTIIFSQFVSLLDLLQIPIDEKGWKMERYDGSMSMDDRNDAITRFTDEPNVNIMLISLKAGNAGLNLVAASRVIILDPFWNPYIEMQAVDRAYRIGQTRSIEVHRILIRETVEDRIIELQEDKKALVNAALDEKASASVSRLGERELAFLFGVVPR